MSESRISRPVLQEYAKVTSEISPYLMCDISPEKQTLLLSSLLSSLILHLTLVSVGNLQFVESEFCREVFWDLARNLDFTRPICQVCCHL